MSNFLIYAAIFPASVLSGMLGIGVAFAAIPILGLADIDLVHAIQPVALLLNGVSALFSAVAFARAGHVDWRTSIALAAVATAFAPIGAYAAQFAEANFLWGLYFTALAGVICLLLAKRSAARFAWPTAYILLAAAPVSALSGLLGVGPGFLMVPIMVYGGVTPRRAAAINAVAVTPSSFAALIPHWGHMVVGSGFILPVAACAAAGALVGGYVSSRRLPEAALRRVFIVVIVALAAYKAVTLIGREPSTSRPMADNCAYEEVAPAVLDRGTCR
jgi:uncharacterized membrane protein YfcA